MRDAVPFLVRAEQVTLIAADLGPERRAQMDRALACLERHGVTAQARNLPGADIDAGDVLLNAIADQGADLLVMGAYGHSRLRELVLGGATRHVLRHMTAPVLMSH
jgi:nucleotide-binding universal stress UspA family protein